MSVYSLSEDDLYLNPSESLVISSISNIVYKLNNKINTVPHLINIKIFYI